MARGSSTVSNEASAETCPLASASKAKPTEAERARFSVLDGLRGYAAIAVVAYHFGGRSNLPYLVPHAYLAVDLFFVLSGFVMADAYGARLRAGLSAGAFMRLRLIRLLPMLLFGTVAGAVIEIGRPGTAGSVYRLTELAAATVLGSLAIPIPVPTSMEQLIFPINGPAWSLMFELFACVGFVALAKDKTGWRAATATMVTAGLLLGAVCVIFKTTDVGGSLTDWPAGAARVSYSFSAGVVVYSYRNRFPAVNAWIFPYVLLLVFLAPAQRNLWSAGFDFVITVLVLPCLVGCAANARTTPRLEKWSRLSGEMSYPLYAVHYPIVRAVCYLMARQEWGAGLRMLIGVATIGSLVVIARVLFTRYDVPVRRWLTSRLPTSTRSREGRRSNLAGKSPQAPP